MYTFDGDFAIFILTGFSREFAEEKKPSALDFGGSG
jgi:hypothetical protein